MNNKLIPIVITLVVGIILAGSVLMPVLSDAQKNAGASVTKTNSEPYTEYGEYYTEGFTMVIDNPTTATNIKTTTVTVNDESITTRDSWSRHVILSSNNLIVEIDTSTSNTNLLYATYQNTDGFVFNQEIAYHNAVTITYDKAAGTITVSDTAESIDITVSASYCFALSNNKEYLFYNTANQIAGANFSEKDITNKVDGVISVFALNLKVNGGDDMFTWVISDKSGTRVFYDPAAYEGVITATLDYVGAHLVAGTTDIYTGGTPT